MSLLVHWLSAALVSGTAFFAIAWLLSVTVLRRAHPASRALLFTLVLLRFVMPFGPTFSTAAPVGPVTAPLPAVVTEPSFPLLPLLLCAWLAGVALISLKHLRSFRRLRRAMRVMPLAEDALTALVHRHADAMGAPRPLVRVSALGPAVTGIFRPVLLLPAGARGDTLTAMLAHELEHLRRRDPLVRALQSLAETLFFFWPPVLLASRWLSLAREQACDLAAVESKALTPHDYATLLVDTARAAPARLAMAASPSLLQRRIDMVLNERKPKQKWWALAAAGVVGLSCSSARPTVVTATAPAPVPTIEGGYGDIDSQLDARAIRTEIAFHQYELLNCYHAFLQERPGEARTLPLHWSIEADGRVGEVCAGVASTPDQRFDNCVSARVSSWVFPAPVLGQPVHVEMPFAFSLLASGVAARE